MTGSNQIRNGFLVAWLLVLILATRLGAQEVRGTVLQKDSKSPLPSVNVLLEDTKYGTVTDSLGRFELRGFPLGVYVLEARRVGYATNRYILTVRNQEPIDLIIELEIESIRLPGVVAVDSAQQKKLATLGRKIITSEEIKRSGASTLSVFLRNRYPGLFPTTTAPGLNKGRFPSYRFALYINGALVQFSSDVFDTMLDPEQVDYIEVYRSFGMSPTSTRGSNERIVHIHTKLPEFRR
jgi:hypothetical protein